MLTISACSLYPSKRAQEPENAMSEEHQRLQQILDASDRSSDQAATVVTLLHDSLIKICRKIVGNDAEDCANDAAALIAANFANFRGDSAAQLKAWARTIAANACFGHLRKLKRHRATELGPVDPSASQETASQEVRREEEEQRLMEMLEELNDDERQAVWLRHVENWPIADIANQLDKTPSAIGGLLYRAMASLRKKSSVSEWSRLR